MHRIYDGYGKQSKRYLLNNQANITLWIGYRILKKEFGLDKLP